MSSTAEDLVHKHRLTVIDYHRMGEAGIFHEDPQVELIDGEIIDMPTVGSAHAGSVSRLTDVFSRAIEEAAVLSMQNPIILGVYSEPEPDIALLRPRGDFYTASYPHPEDVLLIVEVSESTLHYDRNIKIPLYARHDIPEVWLVDVQHKELSLFRKPARDQYQDVIGPVIPGIIMPNQLPEVAVDLSGLFPASM